MDIKFREATDEDFAALIELSKDIYRNTDTLVTDLINWLKSDKWFLYVGEINQGKVIAFIAVGLTDGGESLNIRSSRVDKNYRGRGIYKMLYSHAIRHVRERCFDVQRIYRLRPVDIRVPDGYDIMKARCLVKLPWNGSAKACITEQDGNQWKVEFATWSMFKELYESSDTISKLFAGHSLEIYGDVFCLGCEANWAALKERVNVRIMISDCIGRDGRAEYVISFWNLEQTFTNEGNQMVAVNMYGVSKDVIKCHIAQGVLEATDYLGCQNLLFSFFVEKDIMSECITMLNELFKCDVQFHIELNLLCGDLSRKLEDL